MIGIVNLGSDRYMVRIVRSQDDDDERLTVALNGKGRLRKVLTENIHPTGGHQAYSCNLLGGYDAMGRVMSQTQAFKKSDGSWPNYAVSHGYDLAGHVTSQTYPSSRSIGYYFGASGRLSDFDGYLGDGAYRFYAGAMTYNAAGQMTREEFGKTVNPLNHTAGYNLRFQMVEVRLGTSTNWSLSASWNRGKLLFYYSDTARGQNNPWLETTDNNGNVSAQEHVVPLALDGGGNITSSAITMRDDYFYDPLNRIEQVKGYQLPSGGTFWGNIYQQTFTYDQFGNRKIDANPSQTWGNAINTAVYDVNKANNRIYGMQYDAAGNVINEQSTGGAYSYYDAENRMTKAWGNSNWQYYVYNGDGQRVRRIVNNQEHWQVYGIDGELLAEYAVGGVASTPNKEYGYRNGQLLIVAGCDVVRWMVSDHLGTPRMEVDTTGSLVSVKRHDYLPFGEELFVGVGGTATAPNIRTTQMGYLDGMSPNCVRQHLTGKDRDNETGLDYFLARYYSSVQGRFTSPDVPFADQNEGDPQTWNLYVYVGNNPLKYTDPFGAWKKVSCSSGDCWEAEKDDDLGTLAKQTGISIGVLNWAFFLILPPDKIIPGETVVNVAGVEDEARALVERAAREYPMFVPGGGGIIKLGPAIARGTASLISSAWSGIRNSFRRGSSGSATSIARPVTGQIFERTIQTSKGPVDVLAEIVVQGDKIVLKDIAIYGRGSEPLTGLTRELLGALSALKEEAKALGFKQLQIIGKRVGTSSSANPGHSVNVTVNLQ